MGKILDSLNLEEMLSDENETETARKIWFDKTPGTFGVHSKYRRIIQLAFFEQICFGIQLLFDSRIKTN